MSIWWCRSWPEKLPQRLQEKLVKHEAGKKWTYSGDNYITLIFGQAPIDTLKLGDVYVLPQQLLPPTARHFDDKCMSLAYRSRILKISESCKHGNELQEIRFCNVYLGTRIFRPLLGFNQFSKPWRISLALFLENSEISKVKKLNPMLNRNFWRADALKKNHRVFRRVRRLSVFVV